MYKALFLPIYFDNSINPHNHPEIKIIINLIFRMRKLIYRDVKLPREAMSDGVKIQTELI